MNGRRSDGWAAPPVQDVGDRQPVPVPRVRAPAATVPAHTGAVSTETRPDTPPAQPAPLVVRLAREDELDAAGTIARDAFAEDGVASGGYLDRLADAAGRAREADLLVAVLGTGTGHGEQVVGTVTFAAAGTPYADIAREDEAEFRMLAVTDAARGHGAGTAMVHACAQRARDLGARALVLSVVSTAQAPHRLYERLGFTRESERDWYPEPGTLLDVFSLDLGTDHRP